MPKPKPKPNTRSDPRLRWVLRGCLVVLALALGAGLIEATVRGFGLAPEIHPIVLEPTVKTVYRLSTNPLLGYELKPDYRDESPDFVTSYRRTNAHGQRDLPRALTKEPGTTRILLLGDSVVAGLRIPDLDLTLSRRWETLTPTNRLEVLNFGVSGYNTLAEVETLAVKGVRFDPDYVVLVFTENDFDNFNRRAFQLSLDHERPRWARFLFRHSDAARLIFLRFDLFHWGLEARPTEWNRRAMGDNNVVEGLRRLSELSRKHGFETWIAIWPRFTDDGIVDAHPMAETSDTLIVEDLADMHGLSTFRFSRWFERDFQAKRSGRSPRIVYTIGDGMHPSQTGCEVAARGLQWMLDRFRSLPDTERAGAPLAFEATEDGTEAAAISAAKRLGGREPEDSRVFYNRGRELEREGAVDRAMAAYKRAIEINPEYGMARNNLGILLAEQGRVDEAIVQFEQAIRDTPFLPESHLNLAAIYQARGEVAVAIEHGEKAVAANPDSIEACFLLSQLRGGEGDIDRALQWLNRVIDLDPKHRLANQQLGLIHATRGRLTLAAKHLKEALNQDPDSEELRAQLGKVQEAIARAGHGGETAE